MAIKGDLVEKRNSNLDLEPRKVVTALKKAMNYPKAEGVDKLRIGELKETRQFITAYMYCNYPSLSLHDIGFYCFGYDHASVLHCKKKVRDYLDTDNFGKDRKMWLTMENTVENMKRIQADKDLNYISELAESIGQF